MKIIYKNENGGVSIITPTHEALKHMTIDEIALKDVPTGLPFAIVEDSEIPEDRSFRDAWTIEDSLLTGGVGADYGSGSENILIRYDKLRNPVVMSRQEYAEQQGFSL